MKFNMVKNITVDTRKSKVQVVFDVQPCAQLGLQNDPPPLWLWMNEPPHK